MDVRVFVSKIIITGRKNGVEVLDGERYSVNVFVFVICALVSVWYHTSHMRPLKESYVFQYGLDFLSL